MTGANDPAGHGSRDATTEDSDLRDPGMRESTTPRISAQEAEEREARVRGLLKAGAVLPPDTEGAGDRAVPLTARAYGHPGLEGRTIVRLVAGELGAAEDLAAGFLGLTPSAEPVVVGLGLRQALGFPAWVLAHHPEDGHQALAVVPELERAAKQAKSKPKAALDAHQVLAAQLAAAVPHFLPTFYEQAGRVFLAVENPTYAAQMFARARTAEAEHGLVVDEDRLDAVFLEFALAGALPVKVLAGYAKDLSARVTAPEALRRFASLCVRRTAGGLPPSAQMTTELLRLAKAAGDDVVAVEGAYLADLLALPATMRAPEGWWRSHRAAFVRLARQDTAFRTTLLNVMPPGGTDAFAELWLSILIDSGATEALSEPLGTPAAREAAADSGVTAGPADGTAGWFTRFTRLRGSEWHQRRMPELYALVERMAGRLRAELAETGEALAIPGDVDLLDLLLSLGVPIADPPSDGRLILPLENWALGEGQRDLLALNADPRFRPPFHQTADRFDQGRGLHAIRMLAGSPGGRPMLTEWMRDVATRSFAAGLPELPDSLMRLGWLPAEALVLAPDEVAAATKADLSRVLSRTLRAGLFDELGWPAWDEACATLISEQKLDDLVVSDAWPHLIVAGPAQARVLAADGTVLTHDLRIPANDSWGSLDFHHVDGELLVQWSSRELQASLRGYWHSDAGRPQPMEREHQRRWSEEGQVTLPLHGGGRTTGGGVLHRGDTLVPPKFGVISDGMSFWAWLSTDDGDGWHEYDPATGEYGRRSMPGFLADALRASPPGAEFLAGWMLPAPSQDASPACVPVDGLLGWRVVRLPGGHLRCEDLAGRVITLDGSPDGPGQPRHILTFPGDDRPRALVRHYRTIKILDHEGVVTSEAPVADRAGAFAAGTLRLPPTRYWCHLRPRDPDGSVALRDIGDDTAATLLRAAVGGEQDLPALIRRLLPRIRHDALVAGVAGVVRFAAKQQAALDTVATRLVTALSGAPRDEAPAGPADELLLGSLSGFGYGRAYGETDGTFRQLLLIGRALRDTAAPAAATAPTAPGVPLHLDGTELPRKCLDWVRLLGDCAAIAYRASTPFLETERADALHDLLRTLDTLGLTTVSDPARWRLFTLRLAEPHLADPYGERKPGTWLGLLPVGGDALLAFVDYSWAESNATDFTALYFDPSGRFEVPRPYEVRDSAPVGVDRPQGWLDGALGERIRRGPAEWRPEAADEFARLTGVSPTLARLVVAGLPNLDGRERDFLTPETRKTLGVKTTDAVMARNELRRLDSGVLKSVLAALLPSDPARLWTEGPDVAAAAAVWNDKVGSRPAVPEWLLAETLRAVKCAWGPADSLPAVFDPAAAPELGTDLRWHVKGDRVHPVDGQARGFTAGTLTGFVPLAAWLAHRLPAGDPVRAKLPAALGAVRERLANPDLLLDLGSYVSLPDFRALAGAPAETGEGWERYGAVIMATHDDQPAPALRVALLDAAGGDPHLPALRGDAQQPFPAELSLRLALDSRFAALLDDPGEPIAGGRDKDGCWWPQDPSRSVPGLVTEVAKEHGLGDDAAALYLMLLTMPDPTDRNVARWTGWKPVRSKAARAELAATDLVVEAERARAGRSLFLPGGWAAMAAPLLPLEQWKLSMYELVSGQSASLGVGVPIEPVAGLYATAWQRVRDDDRPRFEQLKIKRGRRR